MIDRDQSFRVYKNHKLDSLNSRLSKSQDKIWNDTDHFPSEGLLHASEKKTSFFFPRNNLFARLCKSCKDTLEKAKDQLKR